MGKILNAHGIVTAAEIKTNADIPLDVDMTVVGTTVDCVNIKVTDIKNLLGSASTSVGGLCSDANVNKWSFFSPVSLSRDAGGKAISIVKTPYTLGAFAGYNHTAKPPTWYQNYNVNWTQTKTATYQFDTGFNLRRGERAPDDIESRWDYIRLKAIITDNTNSRIITIYSAIFAITSASYVTIPLIYTDSSNANISGTVTIIGEYVNSTGVTIYGLVEDEHPQVNINIKEYAIYLTSGNFQTAIPITLRWYYVQNTINPYTNLVYSDYNTDLKLINLSAYNSYTANGNLLVSRLVTGSQIPAKYGTSYPADQWPLVYAVTYNSTTGEYRKYTVVEIGNYVLFDTIYRSPADMTYTYKLVFSSTLTAWPTSV